MGFERDIVVSAGHVPIAHGDVVRVERVYAVGVLCLRLKSFRSQSENISDRGHARAHAIIRCAVDVYILQEQVFGCVNRHRPELTLHEADALEDGVPCIADDEIDRSAGLVRDPVSVFVPTAKGPISTPGNAGSGHNALPDLSIPVKRSVAVAGEQYIVAAKLPSKGHVLVPQRQAVVRPICYVGSPLSPCSRSANSISTSKKTEMRTSKVPPRSTLTLRRPVVFITRSM